MSDDPGYRYGWREDPDDTEESRANATRERFWKHPVRETLTRTAAVCSLPVLVLYAGLIWILVKCRILNAWYIS